MNNITPLKVVIEKVIDKLKEIDTNLSIVSINSTMHEDSMDFFKKNTIWLNKLNNVLSLLEIRKVAYDSLDKLNKTDLKIDNIDKKKIEYLGKFEKFTIVRFILTQQFLNISWTIIDSISAVIGEQLFPTKILKHESKPIRLIEYFLSKDNGLKHLGTNLYPHIINNYGWPVSLFYYIRNFFIHEGFCNNEIEIFQFQSPHSDVFKIKSEIKDKLFKNLKEKSKLNENNYRGDENIWKDNDLLIWFKECLIETDELLGILLEYGTNLISDQLRLFLNRDIKNLK